MPAKLPGLRAIPGFALTTNFLTREAELALLALIRRYGIPRVPMRGRFLRRRMLCFGLDFGPNFLTLRPAPPLPQGLHRLRRRCAGFAGVNSRALTQAIVQVFPPGASLGWHVDAEELGPIVIGVSLGGNATLRFAHPKFGLGNLRRQVSLPPRSAYILSGKARLEWFHALAPVREERISITFRAPTVP